MRLCAVALVFASAGPALSGATDVAAASQVDVPFLIALGGIAIAGLTLLLTAFLIGRQIGLQQKQSRTSGANDATAGRSPLPVHETSEAISSDTADLLGRQAGQIIQLVEASVGNHRSYADQLREIEGQIESVRTAEQLRSIANRLATENHRMRLEAQSMATQLETSRGRIETLQRNLARAKDESLRDPLTEVGNRRAFDSTFETAVADAAKTGAPLSVVLADIDAFKKINDEHGHGAGDEILKRFARVLSDMAQPKDTVARYGGEEFAIIVPGTESLAASVLAERMRSRIEAEPFAISAGQTLQVTASLGVAELRSGEAAPDLIGRADARLYRAKNLGRNRVVTT